MKSATAEGQIWPVACCGITGFGHRLLLMEHADRNQSAESIGRRSDHDFGGLVAMSGGLVAKTGGLVAIRQVETCTNFSEIF